MTRTPSTTGKRCPSLHTASCGAISTAPPHAGQRRRSAGSGLRFSITVPGVSLSVVIPVFNEASHLGDTMDHLVAAIETSGFDAEVIVVDDGSTDGSARE